MTTATISTGIISSELKVFARRKWPLANDKYRKNRLADLLSLTKRRIRSLYEGEDTAVPRTTETDAIERLIGKKIGAAAELEEAQHEHRTLAEIAASLQALLQGPNAAFYSPQVAALRAALAGEGPRPHSGGAVDGAGDFAGAGDTDD